MEVEEVEAVVARQLHRDTVQHNLVLVPILVQAVDLNLGLSVTEQIHMVRHNHAPVPIHAPLEEVSQGHPV
jgi:hypothetical protein